MRTIAVSNLLQALRAFLGRHSGLLKYAFGLTVLALVIWKYSAPLGKLLREPIQPRLLVLAAALYFSGVMLTFVRWYILVRAQELPFTVWNALRLGMAGFFLSNFLPGSIGGDLFKAAFLAKDQNRRTVAVATVLIDRVIGLWALFWLVALLGSVFWFADDPSLHDKSLQFVYFSAVGVVVGSVLVWVLMGFLPEWRANRFAGRLGRIPKVGHSAAEFWKALWMYRLKSKFIALALGLSLIGHFGFVLGFYYSAKVFQTQGVDQTMPSMAEHFLIVPIGMTVQAGFPSPGGMGGAEYVFGWLYKLVLHTDEAQARGVLASLVYRMIAAGLGVIGFVVYLVSKPSMPIVQDPPRTEDGEDKNGFFNGEASSTEVKSAELG